MTGIGGSISPEYPTTAWTWQICYHIIGRPLKISRKLQQRYRNLCNFLLKVVIFHAFLTDIQRTLKILTCFLKFLKITEILEALQDLPARMLTPFLSKKDTQIY
jgi:hypothetical protein